MNEDNYEDEDRHGYYLCHGQWTDTVCDACADRLDRDDRDREEDDDAE